MPERLGAGERRQIAHLSRALEFREGFEFHVVVGDSRAVVKAAIEEVLGAAEVPREPVRQGDEPKLFAVRWLKPLEDALSAGGTEPVVLDAWDDEVGHDEHWGWVFSRLNERRNSIAQGLGRPLILLLSPHGESLLGHFAPDVWAIRGVGMRLVDRVRLEPTRPDPPARVARGEPSSSVGEQIRRRALLIGAPHELRGTKSDISSIRSVLERWGFHCEVCFGTDATRDGILASLYVLCDEVQPDDAIAIYYSGHGGRVKVGREHGMVFNYIVPSDHGEGEFRGILGFELAEIVHAIASKTRNVTVILECSYALSLVREVGGLEGATERGQALMMRVVELEDFPEVLRGRLSEATNEYPALSPSAHPDVVYVLSTEEDDPGFEYVSSDGAYSYFTRELCGATTDALVRPAPWRAIIERVRERVFARRRSVAQRPTLRGPGDRLPFSLETVTTTDDYTTLMCDPRGRTWIPVGRVHGLSVGDEVRPLAEDTVGRVSMLQEGFSYLEWSTGEVPPRTGSTVTLGPYSRKLPVWVDPSLPDTERLVELIKHAMRLELADEPRAGEFRVVSHHAGLLLEGEPWLRRHPVGTTARQLERLVRDLDDLARSRILVEELGRCPEAGVLPQWEARVLVSVGSDSRSRVLVEGEVLSLGQRLHVELRLLERGLDALYVNVLERGLSGRLALLNRSEPAGVLLVPMEIRWVGRTRHGGPPGFTLRWPDDVPVVTGLTEEVIVVASARPLDLRNLLPKSESRSAVASRTVWGDSLPNEPDGIDLPIEVRTLCFSVRPGLT